MGDSRRNRSHLKMKLLVLCLFGVALATASFEVPTLDLGTRNVAPYGWFDDLIEIVVEELVARVQETIDHWINIAKQIRELVSGIIDSIKKCLEEKCVETAVNELLDELKAKILAIVDEFIDKILKDVIEYVNKVIEKIDDLLDGWDDIKEKVFEWIDKLVTESIDTIMDVLRSILEMLNEIAGKDWDGFIDEVMAAVKAKLDEAFAE